MIDSSGFGCDFVGFMPFFSLLRRRLARTVEPLATRKVKPGSAKCINWDQHRFQRADFMVFVVFLWPFLVVTCPR